jgi:hypothetical protein
MVIQFLARNSCTDENWAESAGVLLWWRNKSPVYHLSGHFHYTSSHRHCWTYAYKCWFYDCPCGMNSCAKVHQCWKTQFTGSSQHKKLVWPFLQQSDAGLFHCEDCFVSRSYLLSVRSVDTTNLVTSVTCSDCASKCFGIIKMRFPPHQITFRW